MSQPFVQISYCHWESDIGHVVTNLCIAFIGSLNIVCTLHCARLSIGPYHVLACLSGSKFRSGIPLHYHRLRDHHDSGSHSAYLMAPTYNEDHGFVTKIGDDIGINFHRSFHDISGCAFMTPGLIKLAPAKWSIEMDHRKHENDNQTTTSHCHIIRPRSRVPST